MITIHFVVLMPLHLMLFSIFILLRDYQQIKKAGTSVAFPLIVQILTLTSSLLIYLVRGDLVHGVMIFYLTVGFSEIESFTVADLPFDMTVYPQVYQLNCTKIGHHEYGISMNIGSTTLASYTGCNDASDDSPCPGIELVSSSNTIRYTVDVTWDGMIVSSGLGSQSTTGDQMYQCIVEVTNQPIKRRNIIIKGNKICILSSGKSI